MPPSQFVDISKFPENEKPHIIELALKHNALNEDVDKISGTTVEEKAELHGFMARFRPFWHFICTKGFIGSVYLFLLTTILNKLGISTTSWGPELLKMIFSLGN